MCAGTVGLLTVRRDWLCIARRAAWTIAGALLVLLCLSGSKAGPDVFQRIATFADGSSVGTLQGRVRMWEGGLQMFAAHPLLGSGIGSFPLEAARYQPSFPSATQVEEDGLTMASLAHNEYVQLGAEIGLVGLLLHLTVLGGFFVATVRALRRTGPGTRRSILLATLAAIVSQSIDSLGNPAWHFTEINLVFWALLGLGMGAAMPARRMDSSKRLITGVRRPVTHKWVSRAAPVAGFGLCLVAVGIGIAGRGFANPSYAIWRDVFNNNYSYALDSRMGFLQPGDRGGIPLPGQFNTTELIASLLADGLELMDWSPGEPQPQAPAGKCLLAVAMDPTTRIDEVVLRQNASSFTTYPYPRRDFHIYRYNLGGRWTHKPGTSKARALRNPGPDGISANADDVEVFNPSTANRGRYTQFVGYFLATPEVAAAQTGDVPEELVGSSASSGRLTLLLSCGRANPSIQVPNVYNLIAPLPSWEIYGYAMEDPTYLNGGYGYGLEVPYDTNSSWQLRYIRVVRGVVIFHYNDRDTNSYIRGYFDDTGVEQKLSKLLFLKPSLSIRRDGTAMEIDWAAFPTNFVLQARTNLIPGSPWSLVAGQPGRVSGIARLRLPRQATDHFFRLNWVE